MDISYLDDTKKEDLEYELAGYLVSQEGRTILSNILDAQDLDLEKEELKRILYDQVNENFDDFLQTLFSSLLFISYCIHEMISTMEIELEEEMRDEAIEFVREFTTDEQLNRAEKFIRCVHKRRITDRK